MAGFLVVLRQFVRSIAGGLDKTMAIFRQLVDSIGGDLYDKITVFKHSVDSVIKDLEYMLVVFKGREFVRSIGQGLAFIIASILLNLISNRIWDADQNHVSGLLIFLHYIPESFIHYLPWTIMTLMLWGINNHFFIKLQDTGRLPLRVAGLPNPHGTGPSNLQGTGSLSPQSTGPPNLQGTGPLNPQGTGPPNLQGTGLSNHHSTGSSNLQGTGSLNPQGAGPSNPQGTGLSAPHGAGSPDLGILDNDLRLFFDHLKQNYSLPAPAMLPTSAIQSIAWAEASPGNMALTVHIKGVVTDVELVYKPVVTLPTGSKVLYRRFEIGFGTEFSEIEDLRKLVLESMTQARVLDPDCTLQFGSFAVLKYTDVGLKWWRLQEHWTPSIADIRQSPGNLLDSLSGYRRKWIIRGRNLQTATLKASTVDEVENLEILHHYKVGSGEDELLCEEPQLARNAAAMFRGKKLYICASNSVEVQDRVVFDIQSEPKIFRKTYWIFVMKSLIPSLWTMTMIFSLSLLRGFSHLTRGKQNDLFPKLARGYFDLQHEDIIAGTNLEGNAVLPHTLNELYKFFLVYLFVICIPIVGSTLWQFLCDQISQLGYDFRGHQRINTADGTTRIPSPTFLLPGDNNLLEDTLSIATPSFENNQSEDMSTSSPTLTTPIDSTIHHHLQEPAGDILAPPKDTPDGQDLSTRHALDGYPTVSLEGLVGPVKDPKYQLESQGPSETNSYLNPVLNQGLKNIEEEGVEEGNLQEYKNGVYGTDSPDLPQKRLQSHSVLRSLKESDVSAAQVDFGEDQESGNVSYATSSTTGKSLWHDPSSGKGVMPTPKPPPPLPPDWKEAIDIETGHIYYYSLKTNESSWERPKAPTIVTDQDKKPENSLIGPQESPFNIVDSHLQKPVGYKSIEKGKVIMEHGDETGGPQVTAPDFGAFGDTSSPAITQTLSGSPTVNASRLHNEDKLKKTIADIVKGEAEEASNSKQGNNRDTQLENDSRKKKKTMWALFKSGRRSSAKQIQVAKQIPVVHQSGIVAKLRERHQIVSTGAWCFAGAIREYTFSQVKKATQDFSTRIGSSRFSIVYKATFEDGVVAAVKRFRYHSTMWEQEVDLLSSLSHRALLNLVGYCEDFDAGERMLLYEFMDRGSLYENLHGYRAGTPLTWEERIRVIISVGFGIQYLHYGTNPPIIHRSIESSKILLSSSGSTLIAKLAGFRWGVRTVIDSEVMTANSESKPPKVFTDQMDPGSRASKTDVYSFGVVLLELVTGSKLRPQQLVNWVKPFLLRDDIGSIIDPNLEKGTFQEEQLRAVVELALRCREYDYSKRPTSKEVVAVLIEVFGVK